MKRKTEKDYHELAESRGFKWVGEMLPKNTKDPTLWECAYGDRWEAQYNSIQQGSGCPVCCGLVKKTEQDYQKLAKSRGFKWVGASIKSTCTDTLWFCKKCGHNWKAKYNDIYNGNGCPCCAGKIRKIEKDYNMLAKGRGFVWLGKVLPKATKCRTWWGCKKCGCRWEAKYNKIQQGTGCPACFRVSELDYHTIGKSRGIFWVGVVLPEHVLIRTWWECKKCGYRWEARYSSIQQGSGCSNCKDMINGAVVSKPQRKLNNLLCGSLNYPEGKYRIDVAIMRKSQKIAVEYDCQYWHGGREGHDAKRDGFLISGGWKVLHVKSSHLLPTRKQLTTAIGYLLNTEDKVYNLYLGDWK